MTDRQFVLVKRRFDYTLYDDGTSSIYDRKDDKYYFDTNLDGLEELLNNLDEENEQLRKEEIQLRDDLQYYKTRSASFEEELLSLRKRNEQLRSANKLTETFLITNAVNDRISELEKDKERCQKSFKIVEKHKNEWWLYSKKLEKENEKLRTELEQERQRNRLQKVKQ